MEDGKALTSATTVDEDVNDVDGFRDAVCAEVSCALPANVAASDLTVFADRVAYIAKQALDEDSRTGPFGGLMEHALVVVVKAPAAPTLTTQASYPPFLNKAIEIANVMLPHHGYFQKELDANRTTIDNLRDVKVEFRRPDTGFRYGWTDRSASAKVIFVNDVLLRRMETINQVENVHEYQCIVFVVAVTIFHECAHLALRWKNILDNPPTYGFDVGAYMEWTLFHGTCRVKLQQSTRAKTSKKSKRNCDLWTKEMPILDVVIDGNALRVIRADHLNNFFTPGKLCDKELFPLELRKYSRTKGAAVYRDAARQRPPKDPNIMMPPLCGISKNRFAP